VIRSVLALVVVLAVAAAVGVVFARFASPRGCGVYSVEAGSGAIRCVEVAPQQTWLQARRDWSNRCVGPGVSFRIPHRCCCFPRKPPLLHAGT
jgi:hypothetical protein